MARRNETPRAIVRRGRELPSRAAGRPSALEVIRRLPTGVLVPGLVVLFGALLANLVIADPLPVVDEATMLWGLVQGLRVVGERRRAAIEARRAATEPEVVADVLPDGTVGAV